MIKIALTGLMILIVSPVFAEEMDLLTGDRTNEQGISAIKITNNAQKLKEFEIYIVNCDTYQIVSPDLWRTNIDPKQKDYDKFKLSPGNIRYFGIQFKNPGCYQICLEPLGNQIFSNTCKPVLFK